MKDKTIIITGASDGIGAAAAEALHARGARVIVIGRSPAKTKHVAQRLQTEYFVADFAKFSEVRRLAEQLRQTCPRIDVLINNAGGIFGARQLTEDGRELTMQVNHWAPFLLTMRLLDILLKSHAGVINTSSIASRRFSRFDMRDVELAQGFTPNRAYGNAKLANILFTKELHRRYHKQGLSAVAVHPGIIATGFAGASSSPLRFIYRSPLAKWLLASPQQGAEPLVWLATGQPGTDWRSGAYYEKHQPGPELPQAQNNTLLKDFWQLSETYTR